MISANHEQAQDSGCQMKTRTLEYSQVHDNLMAIKQVCLDSPLKWLNLYTPAFIYGPFPQISPIDLRTTDGSGGYAEKRQYEKFLQAVG